MTFTGVTISDANQYEFDLAGLQLDAEDLWLSYDNTNSAVLMGGTFDLPQLNTTISLSQQKGQYFSVAPGPQVSFVGQIQVSSIPIYGDWSLSDVNIDVNTTGGNWVVSGVAKIIGPAEITGSADVSLDVTFAVSEQNGLQATVTLESNPASFQLYGADVQITKATFVTNQSSGNAERVEPAANLGGVGHAALRR